MSLYFGKVTIGQTEWRTSSHQITLLKYLNTKTKHYPQCNRRKQRLDGSLPAKKKSSAVGNLGSLWAKNRWRPKEKKYSSFLLQKSLLLYLMLFAGSRNSKKLILKVAIQVKLRSTKNVLMIWLERKTEAKNNFFDELDTHKSNPKKLIGNDAFNPSSKQKALSFQRATLIN